jgi:response regulator NasT
MQEFFQESLTRLGHDVIAVAASGKQLVEQCHDLEPDLVITDIKMPDMDGLDAAQQIYRNRPIPIVVVTAYHDSQFVERAERSHILAYLLKPIQDADLVPAIMIAMRRFEEFQALHQEADNLRQALEDRKVIERAKGILMKQAQLDEESAFRRLQKLARSNSKKLVEVARMIVVTAQALEPSDED